MDSCLGTLLLEQHEFPINFVLNKFFVEKESERELLIKNYLFYLLKSNQKKFIYIIMHVEVYFIDKIF